MVSPFIKLTLFNNETELITKNYNSGKCLKIYRYDVNAFTFSPGKIYKTNNNELLFLNDIVNVRTLPVINEYEKQLLLNYKDVQLLYFYPLVAAVIFIPFMEYEKRHLYEHVGILYKHIFYQYINGEICKKHINQLTFDLLNRECLYIHTIIEEKYLKYKLPTNLTQCEFILRLVGISRKFYSKSITELSLNELSLYLTKRCDEICFKPNKVVEVFKS